MKEPLQGAIGHVAKGRVRILWKCPPRAGTARPLGMKIITSRRIMHHIVHKDIRRGMSNWNAVAGTRLDSLRTFAAALTGALHWRRRMKTIVDEAGEVIAKATDDHTLIGGHHRLAVAASLGQRLFWRDTGEPVKLDLFFRHKFYSTDSLSRSPRL